MHTVGVGIDMVALSSIEEQLQIHGEVFEKHTFSKGELEESYKRSDRVTYLAGRFAVKEAVFKAVAHLLPEKTFDFRIVETRSDDYGCPFLVRRESINQILEAAKVKEIYISISNEKEYVVAIAEAIGE